MILDDCDEPLEVGRKYKITLEDCCVNAEIVGVFKADVSTPGCGEETQWDIGNIRTLRHATYERVVL